MRIIPALLLLAACSSEPQGNGVLADGPETAVRRIEAASVTPELRTLVEGTVPGMTILEVERKDREGRTYYDVEGRRDDGSAVEIDVLAEANGTLRAVEIQRDISWLGTPADVKAAAAAPFTPARVIESRQVDDETTIYELFAPGKPDEPAMEVRVAGGRATRMTERNAH